MPKTGVLSDSELWAVLSRAGFPDAGRVPAEPHALTPRGMAFCIARAESGGNPEVNPDGLFQKLGGAPHGALAQSRQAFAMSGGGMSWAPWCTAFGCPAGQCGHRSVGDSYLSVCNGRPPAYYSNVHTAKGLSGGGVVYTTLPAELRAAGYRNPLRFAAYVPGRTDEGVDFSGAGPFTAIGPGHVVNVAYSFTAGQPYIAVSIDSGPWAGRVYYVAENIVRKVRIGQTVTASTVLGIMTGGIEVGWSNAAGDDPLAKSYGGYTEGSRTALGVDMWHALKTLGTRVGKQPTVQMGRDPYAGGSPGASSLTPKEQKDVAFCQDWCKHNWYGIAAQTSCLPDCLKTQRFYSESAAARIGDIMGGVVSGAGTIVGGGVSALTGGFLKDVSKYLAIAGGGVVMLAGLAVVIVAVTGTQKGAGRLVRATPLGALVPASPARAQYKRGQSQGRAAVAREQRADFAKAEKEGSVYHDEPSSGGLTKAQSR